MTHNGIAFKSVMLGLQFGGLTKQPFSVLARLHRQGIQFFHPNLVLQTGVVFPDSRWSTYNLLQKE